VAPHVAQNFCPASVDDVPQLGQKMNPLAMLISL
jgi:hypothetical protein